MTGICGRVGALVVIGLWCVPASAGPSDATTREFTNRVRAYMELRHQATRDVPPLQVSADWSAIEAARDALAGRLHDARANAAMGEIFTAEAGPTLRHRIGDVLREHGVTAADVLADLADEAPTVVHARVKVNERFDWMLGALMPGYIIAALPPLPDELQYRFVGHALVLLDTDAGLIVDVLPRALVSR